MLDSGRGLSRDITKTISDATGCTQKARGSSV